MPFVLEDRAGGFSRRKVRGAISIQQYIRELQYTYMSFYLRAGRQSYPFFLLVLLRLRHNDLMRVVTIPNRTPMSAHLLGQARIELEYKCFRTGNNEQRIPRIQACKSLLKALKFALEANDNSQAYFLFVCRCNTQFSLQTSHVYCCLIARAHSIKMMSGGALYECITKLACRLLCQVQGDR
jgi:hypothetical protein